MTAQTVQRTESGYAIRLSLISLWISIGKAPEMDELRGSRYGVYRHIQGVCGAYPRVLRIYGLIYYTCAFFKTLGPFFSPAIHFIYDIFRFLLPVFIHLPSCNFPKSISLTPTFAGSKTQGVGRWAPHSNALHSVCRHFHFSSQICPLACSPPKCGKQVIVGLKFRTSYFFSFFLPRSAFLRALLQNGESRLS